MTSVFVAGCGSEEDRAKLSAQKIVAARLKDPDSARFGTIFTVEAKAPVKPANIDSRWVAACGTVQGKNSFGGYADPVRFVVLKSFDSKFKTEDTIFYELETTSTKLVADRDSQKPESAFELIYWNKYCVDAAHPPTYTGTAL